MDSVGKATDAERFHIHNFVDAPCPSQSTQLAAPTKEYQQHHCKAHELTNRSFISSRRIGNVISTVLALALTEI